MTGMKEGAGEDPFAEDASTTDPTATERSDSDGIDATDDEPVANDEPVTNDEPTDS
ncbi:hypothetical protein [Haladaptatus sp. DYF46]|uniref:hypothetical protein n=1 Tax=Haladaptatus sp. DYF46 TaxID=2886041 RepID=UPI001E5E6793|nr:hypothetical protein [Haladaptatus sp. DYF46]